MLRHTDVQYQQRDGLCTVTVSDLSDTLLSSDKITRSSPIQQENQYHFTALHCQPLICSAIYYYHCAAGCTYRDLHFIFLVVPPALSTLWGFGDSKAVISVSPILLALPLVPLSLSISITTVAVAAAAAVVTIPFPVAVSLSVSMTIPSAVSIASLTVVVVTVSVPSPVLCR